MKAVIKIGFVVVWSILGVYGLAAAYFIFTSGSLQ
jgi:hypothetical protein